MSDSLAPVQIWVEMEAEPTGPAVTALYRVQAAIAGDVQEKLRRLSGAVISRGDLEPTAPLIRIRPGAGALLSKDALQSLVDLVSRRRAEHEQLVVSLPVEGFGALAGEDGPRSAGACFAVRSICDVLALSLHPDAGPAVRRSWTPLPLDAARMEAAMRTFADRQGEAAIIGPITPFTWRYLEDEVACRVRVFADGGRHTGGLAGALYRRSRTEEFVGWLRDMGQAIFLDSRQMFAGAEMPTGDDFLWSDLGQSEEVQHSELRRLTEIALTSDFPIVLGGPSLVNGALFALVEAAWRTGRDVDRGYHVAW